MTFKIDEITAALQHVVHPAKSKNIIDLDMVKDIVVENCKVSFTLVFDKPQDPMRKSIIGACEKALRYYVHPDIEADIVVEPVAQAPVAKEAIAKNVIAVASGKGGVGKSTVAVNLAVALARLGYSVGLLDADVYGPSIPKMMGVEGMTPAAQGAEGAERIIPVERYGVRMLSIGFFVRPEDAVIWRGPMATSALKQLLHQTEWGNPDFLLIDLPPGTGDVHLTIVQELPITGAVIVSTPQQVALADVVKGINMFRNEKVDVPVIGLVENMAWFTPAELPDNRYYLFGKEGCKQLAERENIPLLAQIPIVQSISDSGDAGSPIAENDNTVIGAAFTQMAQKIADIVELF